MARKTTAADRKSLIRLASTLPKGSAERKAILAGLSKKAGSKSTSSSIFKLSSAQIEKDVRKAGMHSKEHIDKYDFSQLMWNPVESHGSGRHGFLTMKWFVYPYDDFGNKASGQKGNYIYGYVEVELYPKRDIGGELVVKTINFVKSY